MENRNHNTLRTIQSLAVFKAVEVEVEVVLTSPPGDIQKVNSSDRRQQNQPLDLQLLEHDVESGTRRQIRSRQYLVETLKTVFSAWVPPSRRRANEWPTRP